MSRTVPANTAETRQNAAQGAGAGAHVHASARSTCRTAATRVAKSSVRMVLTDLTPNRRSWLQRSRTYAAPSAARGRYGPARRRKARTLPFRCLRSGVAAVRPRGNCIARIGSCLGPSVARSPHARSARASMGAAISVASSKSRLSETAFVAVQGARHWLRPLCSVRNRPDTARPQLPPTGTPTSVSVSRFLLPALRLDNPR